VPRAGVAARTLRVRVIAVDSYDVGALTQIGGFVTPQTPMGFGFDGHGRHGYLSTTRR